MYALFSALNYQEKFYEYRRIDKHLKGYGKMLN
jgi:hypothetical protein